MTLTDHQIGLIERSFSQMIPISGLAAELFYARLFSIAPDVQPLFKSDLKVQGAKLMQSLGLVVSGLRDWEAMKPVAADLAARHVVYGVTPAQYEPVGDALIWTLARSLGEAFDPETEAAWRAAYGVISDFMVDSAYARPMAASDVAASDMAAE
ncbi:MAG: globin family protein [Pseudomonadota bacterium]